MMDMRSLILAQIDLPHKEVLIPEWKDAMGIPLTLRVRALTAGEKDRFEKEMLDKQSPQKNVRASLAAKVIIDDVGQRIFTDADIEALAAKNGNAMNRIFEAVLELNKTDIEALEKKD